MSVTSILVQLVASSFGVICILALTEWRFSKRTVVITAAAFVCVMSVVNYILIRDLSYLLDEHSILDFVYRIGNIFLGTMIIVVLTKYTPAKLIFTTLTVIVCVFIVDTLALCLRVWFGVYPIELALELLMYTIMTAGVVWIRKPFLFVVDYLDTRLWSLSIMPALLSASFIMQLSFPDRIVNKPDNIPIALMLCFITAAVYYVVYILFRTILDRSELEQNIKVMELNAIALEHRNDIALQNMKNVAMWRHDLRHVGQIIYSCIETGDLDEAKRLIHDIDLSMHPLECLSPVRNITGHKLLDTVLSYYTDSAKDAEIDVEINMCEMSDMTADKKELAVVLSNALENAVNACLKVEPPSKRVIRMDGRRHGSQFFIEIVNSYNGDAVFDSDTGLPTNAQQGHGYGSQSIAYFAEKNGAAIEFFTDGGFFHMQMLL